MLPAVLLPQGHHEAVLLVQGLRCYSRRLSSPEKNPDAYTADRVACPPMRTLAAVAPLGAHAECSPTFPVLQQLPQSLQPPSSSQRPVSPQASCSRRPATVQPARGWRRPESQQPASYCCDSGADRFTEAGCSVKRGGLKGTFIYFTYFLMVRPLEIPSLSNH